VTELRLSDWSKLQNKVDYAGLFVLETGPWLVLGKPGSSRYVLACIHRQFLPCPTHQTTIT